MKLRPQWFNPRRNVTLDAHSEEDEAVRADLEMKIVDWTAMLKKLPPLELEDSPLTADLTGLTNEQLAAWKSAKDRWELDENRRDDIAKRIQAYKRELKALAQPPSMDRTTSTASHSPSGRMIKVDRHLPIAKYTRALSKVKPFHLWYKLFKREMLRLEVDDKYTLAALIYYVDADCFDPWQESLSPQAMNDLNVVLGALDREFPDLLTPEERRDDFRKWTQTKPGVLAYTSNKERLFRLAYPDKDPSTSSTYKDLWVSGLHLEIRILLRRSVRVESSSVPELVADAVRIEQDEMISCKERYLNTFLGNQEKKLGKVSKKKDLSTRSSQGSRPSSPQSYSRDRRSSASKLYRGTSSASPPSSSSMTPTADGTSSVGICFDYRDKGACPRGDQCRYDHMTSKKSAGFASGKPGSGNLKA